MYFFAGTVADIDNFITAHENQWDKDTDIDCSAIIASKGSVYLAGVDSKHGPWRFECTFTEAIGSGDQYIRAFIASGMKPVDAMKETMKLDAGTGGKIRVYSVENGEFI